MSTMNVFVGNLQLPPFPAEQPASEVYKTLKDAYRGGILFRPNGVGILNNSSLVRAGNYTYVPAASVVPRVNFPEEYDQIFREIRKFLTKASQKSIRISDVDSKVWEDFWGSEGIQHRTWLDKLVSTMEYSILEFGWDD